MEISVKEQALSRNNTFLLPALWLLLCYSPFAAYKNVWQGLDGLVK